MKDKVIAFIKDLILMTIIISVIEFIFYKLSILSEFSFAYIIGFMIGWSIWQLIKLYIDNRKHK